MNNILSKHEAEMMISPLTTLTWSQVTGENWNQPMYHAPILQQDVDTVYYAINTWYYMFQDLAMVDARVIKTYYAPMNIFEICQDAEKCKEHIVENLSTGNAIDDGIVGHHPIMYLLHKFTAPEMHRVITFLNYLKRLPLRGLNTQDKMVNEFIKNQDRLKTIDWDSPSVQLITGQLRHIIYCMLYGIKPDFNVFVLPPKQYLENIGKPYTYGKKFAALSQYALALPTGISSYFQSAQNKEIPDWNQLMIVPKNYKTGRTICIESIAKTYMGYTLSEPITRRITNTRDEYLTLKANGETRYVPYFGCFYNYQEANQNWAWYGSITNEIVTRDLSKASDSLSYRLCELVLPEAIFKFAEAWSSRHCWLPTKKGTMLELSTFMTMGHPLTYPLESVIFYACEVLASCWTEGIDVFSLRPTKHLLDLPRTEVFVSNAAVGDDMVHHVKISSALDFILEKIGFLTNNEKTFVNGYYRESCGKEYYLGHDVTGFYYPRGTSTNKFAELIGVQHKLVEYPLANAFIIDCIRQIHPTTTYSYKDSPYTDIWSLDDPKRGVEKEIATAKTLAPRPIFATYQRKPTGFEIVVQKLIDNFKTTYSLKDSSKKLELQFFLIDACGDRIKKSSADIRGLEVVQVNGHSRQSTHFFPPTIMQSFSHVVLDNVMDSNGYLDFWEPIKGTFDLEEIEAIERPHRENVDQNKVSIHTSVVAEYTAPLPGVLEYDENACYALMLSKTQFSEAERTWSENTIDFSVDIRRQVSYTTTSVVQEKEFLV
jgi:hypothetical protein